MELMKNRVTIEVLSCEKYSVNIVSTIQTNREHFATKQL